MAKPDPLFDDVFAGHGSSAPDPLFDEVFSPPGAKPVDTKKKAEALPSWGAGSSFLNGLLTGTAPYTMGHLQAAKQYIHARLRGEDPQRALDELDNNAKLYEENAEHEHGRYAQASPLTDALAQGTGSLAPLLAGTAGINEGIGALGESIASKFPATEGAVNFATGNVTKNPGFRNWLTRRASQAFTGAVGGAASAGAQSALSNEPIGQQLTRGAEIGSVINPSFGAALEPLLSHLSPLTARAASSLRGLGVNINAGQMPGSPVVLRMLNSIYGDGGEQARQQLTTAAMKSMGAGGTALTSNAIRQRGGELADSFSQFAGMAKDANLNDNILQHDLQSIYHDAATSRISEPALDELRSASALISRNGAPLNGKDYLQLTKSGGVLDRLTRHPEVGEHALQLRDALDDSLERGVQSGFGKWVPSSSAAPGGSPEIAAGLQGPAATRLLGVGLPEGLDTNIRPNFTTNSGGALVPHPQGYQPNFTMPGRPEVSSAPSEGLAEAGPGMPPEPGMEWQYDPGAEGLMNLLRTTRAQYRNMKILDPLADDTTGQLNPHALAGRVDKAFKKSYRSAPAQPSLDMQALGEADNFIPEGGKPGLLSGLMGHFKSGLPAGLAVGAYELSKELPSMEANWKPILATGIAGLAGYGGGKVANAFANGDANTQRLIADALAGRLADGSLMRQTAINPAVQFYNEDDQQGQQQ